MLVKLSRILKGSNYKISTIDEKIAYRWRKYEI